jgi:hypothetical protein
MLHLKLLEKQEQAKNDKSSREIIKIKANINKIETKKIHTKNQQNKNLIP